MTRVKRSDWVVCALEPAGPVGFVKRAAKNGSWADVRWAAGGSYHVKRMRAEALIVKTTIPMGGGLSVTDLTREKELAT